MADEVNYDHESMRDAYEQMIRATKGIASESQQMTRDAMQLLESIEGTYATDYGGKRQALDKEINELNDVMTRRTAMLQQRFEDMADLDKTLAGGF